MRRESRQFNRSWRRRGLTLIQMLVAVGLVAVIIGALIARQLA